MLDQVLLAPPSAVQPLLIQPGRQQETAPPTRDTPQSCGLLASAWRALAGCRGCLENEPADGRIFLSSSSPLLSLKQMDFFFFEDIFLFVFFFLLGEISCAQWCACAGQGRAQLSVSISPAGASALEKAPWQEMLSSEPALESSAGPCLGCRLPKARQRPPTTLLHRYALPTGWMEQPGNRPAPP